ncbi:MAG TPA: hypothetical protein PKI49_11500 [Pseudomonadota bacterium]|jgi:hypothetical protein|nr:hypothetical protein [Pseudomonadota bacterium]HNI60574.1 hypothetical protein [Pseudomonadota bacterium]HNO69127.1 hypothetical protein [Pseudomonadota bacterium]
MASSSADSPQPLIPRLPFYLSALAVLVLCIGVLQMVGGLLEVNTAILTERSQFISSVRDRQLALFDQVSKEGPNSLAAPLRPVAQTVLKLPRAEAEKLFLLLGSDLYERRSVTVPLALLQAILGYLLASSALAALRRRFGGVASWSWACMANIPAQLLNLIVMMVHANRLMRHVGLAAADALAKTTGRPVAVETADIESLLRMYTSFHTAVLAAWVLLLGVLTLLLQNRQGPAPQED